MLDPRTGLVGHRTALVLLDVTFIVSRRVRRRSWPARRTVHAYAQGMVSDLPRVAAGSRLHYNPFESGAFWAAGQSSPARHPGGFRPDGAFIDRYEAA